VRPFQGRGAEGRNTHSRDQRRPAALSSLWDPLGLMKGSDSLLGRHLSFRLHPFSLREMRDPHMLGPDQALESLFAGEPHVRKVSESDLPALMTYGPFPESLLAQDVRKARLWRRNHERLIVWEDLRDLNRLPELGRIELLNALLPDRVGSLLNCACVGRDLEVSIPTAKRWVAYLKALYYLLKSCHAFGQLEEVRSAIALQAGLAARS
jgi:predicted AAA+ superfamily ATPase